MSPLKCKKNALSIVNILLQTTCYFTMPEFHRVRRNRSTPTLLCSFNSGCNRAEASGPESRYPTENKREPKVVVEGRESTKLSRTSLFRAVPLSNERKREGEKGERHKEEPQPPPKSLGQKFRLQRKKLKGGRRETRVLVRGLSLWDLWDNLLENYQEKKIPTLPLPSLSQKWYVSET